MEKVKQHTAPSQTQKVLCRYCPAGSKPILVKNYKRHIEHYHKDKDSSDLKDKYSQSITRWTSTSSKRKCDSDIDIQRVKRRHQSGDSGCATGDDDDEVLETGVREDEKSSASLEQGREEIIDITGPTATGECHSPKSNEQSQQDNDKATTLWSEKESDEEDCDHAITETDESLGLLPVHNPASALLESEAKETETSLPPPPVHNPASALLESEETDTSLGPLLVHNPASALLDANDRQTEAGNDDLLKMLCQLKLGQNRFQLSLERIEESISKISLKPCPETRPDESVGPLLVHNPASALSEEVSAHFSIVKSIKGFEKLDFKYDESKESLCCNICDTLFKYSGQHEFKDEILSVEFRNLKKHVKAHLLSQKHQNKLEENQQEKERRKVFVSKSRQAGLNVGRIVYKNIALRQTKRDYEIDILNTHRAGGEVGNINHSATFVLRLRPYLADAVRDKKRGFLSTHTPETACLPCGCFSADGATHKKECRHFEGKSNSDYPR